MRIAVVGAGAVGGIFGARLAVAGHDVTFVARGATLAALRSTGIHLDSVHGDLHLSPVQVTDDPASIGPVDPRRRPWRPPFRVSPRRSRPPACRSCSPTTWRWRSGRSSSSSSPSARCSRPPANRSVPYERLRTRVPL
ncbi:MAG: hypothetical protein EBV77_09530 [Gemmatimonadaceae bacterium]|nr:hypothetical protein [Gemmatimonadaceae bacterium]